MILNDQTAVLQLQPGLSLPGFGYSKSADLGIKYSKFHVGRRLVSWYPIVSFFLNRSVSCQLCGVGLYCQKFFLRSIFSGGALSTFIIHLSLGKAGPFTLENHIHVQALKMQGFPNKWMPY